VQDYDRLVYVLTFLLNNPVQDKVVTPISFDHPLSILQSSLFLLSARRILLRLALFLFPNPTLASFNVFQDFLSHLPRCSETLSPMCTIPTLIGCMYHNVPMLSGLLIPNFPFLILLSA